MALLLIKNPLCVSMCVCFFFVPPTELYLTTGLLLPVEDILTEGIFFEPPQRSEVVLSRIEEGCDADAVALWTIVIKSNYREERRLFYMHGEWKHTANVLIQNIRMRPGRCSTAIVTVPCWRYWLRLKCVNKAETLPSNGLFCLIFQP